MHRTSHLLNKIQRKGLPICLGVPATAALGALEVEASVLPLDLRREELALREIGKILAKDNNQPIKEAWNDWRNDCQLSEKYRSPFGLANIQIQDMESNTGISTVNVEQEFSYIEGMYPCRSTPEYWKTLGSSKSRSAVQQQEARETIKALVEQCHYNEIIAFTDGSCKGNPGPCGAGACIFVPNQEEPVRLKQPVSQRGSILLGELVAILMAMEFTKAECRKGQVIGITIFSDSQSALGILTLGWSSSSHKQTIKDIKLHIAELEKRHVNVNLRWTPGHADIKGNSIADDLAKEAADEASALPEDSQVITSLDLKNFARLSCSMKWQRRWDLGDTGRHLYAFRPHVSTKLPKYMLIPFIKEKRVISQLRLGYVALKEYRYKIGLEESPNCACGEIETVEHFLCSCDNYELERQKLISQLYMQTGEQVVSTETFLSLEILKEHRESLLLMLDDYITSTKRFQTK